MNPETPQTPQGATISTSATQSAEPSALPPNPSTAQEVAEQAKIIVQNYQNDPFQMSVELQKLKSAYIAQAFQITINPVEN